MGRQAQGRGKKTNAAIKRGWEKVKTFTNEKAVPWLKEAGREVNEFAKEHKLGQAAINALGATAAAFNPGFAAPIGIATKAVSAIASKAGYGKRRGGGMHKLTKGSTQAKAHMAKLRAMQGCGRTTSHGSGHKMTHGAGKGSATMKAHMAKLRSMRGKGGTLPGAHGKPTHGGGKRKKKFRKNPLAQALQTGMNASDFHN